MTQRKPWTEEEDRILIETVSNQPLTKWTLVAKNLKSVLPDCQRTAKQCRDRWRNQLDPLILNNQWKAEQQRKLFQLHKQFGNKWALIARELSGRTDNSVKNHYYCGIRKSMRKFNRSILSHHIKWRFRSITESILTKILHVANNKRLESINLEMQQIAVQIERKLFEMSLTQQPFPSDQVQELGDLIEYFHRNLKGKRGRKRKGKKKEEQSSRDNTLKRQSACQQIDHDQAFQIESSHELTIQRDEHQQSTHQQCLSFRQPLLLQVDKPLLELPIAFDNNTMEMACDIFNTI